MLAVLVIIFLSLILLLYIVKNRKYKSSLPPGPPALPFLGNLLQIGAKPHLKFSQWSQQYGKFYTVYIGQKPALVITDGKLMRELLNIPETAGSFTTEVITQMVKGRYGFLAEGEASVEQKRFLSRVIRQFAFGEFSCRETLMKREISELIDWIKSEQANGKKLHLKNKLKVTSSNIVWNICSGERFSDMDSSIVKLGLDFYKHLQTVLRSGLLVYPWIRHFAPVTSGYTQFKTMSDNIYTYVETTFRKRTSTRSMKEKPECIVDAYIDKMKNCHENSSSFYGESGWKNSVGTIIALFISGGDGTGAMLNWIIFYLSAHPEIQETLQKEIQDVTKNERNVSLSDMPNMPYAEAVILEALRFSSMVSSGITQEIKEDITFHGYKLPKGLLIQPILYHVHYDKTTWGDPENFRPERFLGEGWKLKEFVVAFQPGKRTCPGQVFAMEILFLLMTNLFLKFTFDVDHSNTENANEYLEPHPGFTLEPKNLPILATERQ